MTLALFLFYLTHFASFINFSDFFLFNVVEKW